MEPLHRLRPRAGNILPTDSNGSLGIDPFAQKDDEISPVWFAARLRGMRGPDLEAALRGIFASEELPLGTRLPTIRALAQGLGVSVGTVGAIWSRLREANYISTRRRGGTVVSDGPRLSLYGENRPRLQELTQLASDPVLKPGYQEAVLAGLRNRNINDGRREYITPALLMAVQKTWPFEPEQWTTAAGGAHATVLAIEAAAPRGTTIAVEQPTSSRAIEIISLLGLQAVAVECDEYGPVPRALEHALDSQPSAFYFQPRAQVPLGHHVNAKRMGDLAAVLSSAPHQCWIVEDDNNGPISLAPISSLGSLIPDRVLHIRAFCRAYGLELRTSVLAGASTLVQRVRSLRSYGYAMNSRILQDALAYMLGDRATQKHVDKARQHYARRREGLSVALNRLGVRATGEDGTRLWLEVDNEISAVTNLASIGIIAEPGSRYFLAPTAGNHISISTSRLADAPDAWTELAHLIADNISRTSPDIDD